MIAAVAPAGAVALAGLPVIGAMRAIDLKAPLSAAKPVYRLPDGRIMQAQRHPTEGTVDGQILDDGDWPELIECREACELPESVAPGVPVRVWILRPSGPDFWRGTLLALLDRADGAEVRRFWTGPTCICVVRRDRQDSILDAMAVICDGQALDGLDRRRWDAHSLGWAELATLVETRATPERWGRMIGLMRALRRDGDADSCLAFGRNSWGSAWAEDAGRIADGMAP